jgi:hypothetical protein
VCKRDNIEFTVEGRNDKGTSLSLPVSNRAFKVVLEDAMCELERYSRPSNIPVYSYRTITNPEKFKRLKRLNNRKGYYILKKDSKVYKDKMI